MDRLPRWKRLLPKLRHRRSCTSALNPQMNAESQRQVLYIGQISQPRLVVLNSMAETLMRQPRCLQNVDCTQLLTGGSTNYENFSAGCWLEDHLHRFGLPASFTEVRTSNWGSSNDSAKPPPYVDEPPPSYEEAVAQTQCLHTDDNDYGILWF